MRHFAISFRSCAPVEAIGNILLISCLCLFMIASTSFAGSKIDACTLLTESEVHQLAPGLKMAVANKHLKGVSGCNWLDGHGLPALMLQVMKASSRDLQHDARAALFGSGYQINDIEGLGDQAVIVIQEANPKFGLKEGVAILMIRIGKHQFSLSPARLAIREGTPQYKAFLGLAKKICERL